MECHYCHKVPAPTYTKWVGSSNDPDRVMYCLGCYRKFLAHMEAVVALLKHGSNSDHGPGRHGVRRGRA
jgi:hypothetical protein